MGELLNIGNGILGSVIPVYLGMFFHEFRALEVFLAMLVNIAVVLSFECARMWPPAWVGDCAQCAAEGNPKSKFFGKQYDMQSRNSPGFLQPIGAGDTRETYLHLLPPFWGLIFSSPQSSSSTSCSGIARAPTRPSTACVASPRRCSPPTARSEWTSIARARSSPSSWKASTSPSSTTGAGPSSPSPT